MTPRAHCRLEAGPFDGDEGAVLGQAPDTIWAFACPAAPGPDHSCNLNGVHWICDQARRDRVVEMTGVETHAYQYDRVTAGTMVYTWTGLTSSAPRSERELATA